MSSTFDLVIRYSDGKIKSHSPLASELNGMIFRRWFYEKDEMSFQQFFKEIDEGQEESKLLSPESHYGIAVIDFMTNSFHDCQRAAELSFIGSAAFSLILNHKMSEESDLEDLIEENTFKIIKTPMLKDIEFDTKSIKEWKKRTLKGHFLVFLDQPFEFVRYHPENEEEIKKLYEWMLKDSFPLKKIDHENWKNFISGNV